MGQVLKNESENARSVRPVQIVRMIIGAQQGEPVLLKRAGTTKGSEECKRLTRAKGIS